MKKCLTLTASIIFAISLGAQTQEHFIVGNETHSFGGIANPTTASLPTPVGISPQNFRYNGTTAVSSQNAYFDENGNVVFFIIDGNIFDNSGYLMVDNSSGANCFYCLAEGSSTVSVVQVPGSCNLYYIMINDLVGQAAPFRFYGAILDLSKPNFFFNDNTSPWYDPNRKGVLLHNSNPNGGWPWSAEGFGFGSDFYNPYNDYTVRFPLEDIVGDNEAVHFDIAEDVLTGKHLLMVTTGDFVEKFWLEGTTIIDAGEDLITMDQYEQTRYPKGEAEVFISNDVGTEVRFAYSSYGLDGLLNHRLGAYYTRFNINYPNVDLIHEEYILINEYPASVQVEDFNGDIVLKPRTSGLEFSPNGQYVYYLLDQPHDISLANNFGYLDVSSGSAILNPLNEDLSPYISSQLQWAYTYETNGWLPVLLMVGKDGSSQMGEWRNPDFPNSGSLSTIISPLNSVSGYDYPFSNLDNVFMLLNSQNWSQNPLPPGNPICCADEFYTVSSIDLTAIGATATWTLGSNPFNVNTGPVKISGVLTIPSGANININDMTIEFSPGAKMVIEAGAKVRLDNSVLTNWDCTDERWKGVEVWGNSTLSQVPSSNQGLLSLHANSIVENAEIGILAGQRTLTGFNGSANGGIIITYDSFIKNNWEGIVLLNYLNGSINNRCSFHRTSFETNTSWPDASYPLAMLKLVMVQGVEIDDCRFDNSNPNFFEQFRGYGLKSFASIFRMHGIDSSTNTVIKGLYCGVLTTSPQNVGCKVTDMMFLDNNYGIFDMLSGQAEITSNTFIVPDKGLSAINPVGVVLFQSTDYIVEENIFQGYQKDWSTGIYFLGPRPAGNRIYNNTFDNLFAGSVVQFNHNIPNTAGLQKLCNDYSNNFIDWALNDAAVIAEIIGDPSDPLNYSGNRFFGSPDCNAIFDKYFDPGVPVGAFYDYYRHGTQTCDPECLNNNHYEDHDLGGVFIKEDACAGGRYDDGEIIISHEHLKRRTAIAEQKSAIANLNGTVDLGEKVDVLESINEQPWLPSYELRDILLAHNPLSDDVLRNLFYREEPLDQWHLVQVCISNTPLRRDLFYFLMESGLLDAFHFALVDQAQQGAGISLKELLIQEIYRKDNEKTTAKVKCLRYYATDSLGSPADSIRVIYEEGFTSGERMALLVYYIQTGDIEAAQILLNEEVFSTEEATTLVDVTNLLISVNGEIDSLSSGQLDQIAVYSERDEYGSAWANGILFQLGYINVLPLVELPDPTKNMRTHSNPKFKVKEIELRVQPNPTSGIAYLTYPIEMEGYRFTIMDALGKDVFSGVMNGQGLLEFDLSTQAKGLYLLAVERDGIKVGSVKIEVQ